MAPFIGFIKTGECHILRQVEVMHTLPNGKRVGLVKSTSCNLLQALFNDKVWLRALVHTSYW